MGKSLFGSKSKSKNSYDNQSESTSSPWSEALPYLLGNDTTAGLLPGAQDAYNEGGFTSDMGDALDSYLSLLGSRYNSPAFSNVTNAGSSALQGGFDTQLDPVKTVDPTSARASMGALDPTAALQSLLSGTPNNPYLDSQANSIVNQVTRNLETNVLPSIRSDAMNSGQYGGSRQGIAEGLAASRMNQDLAPALTSLYGGAYENAQDRMAGTANNLNDQAMNTAFGNSNLTLQKNQQNMGNNQLNINNRSKGLDMLDTATGLQDNVFNDYMNSLNIPQQIDWNNVNNYGGLLFPAAQLGSTTNSTSSGTGTGTATSSPGLVPSILGSVAGVAGIGKAAAGGWGSLLGGK